MFLGGCALEAVYLLWRNEYKEAEEEEGSTEEEKIIESTGGGGVSENHVKVKGGGFSKNQAWHILHCTSPPLPINNDQSLNR